MIRVSFDPPGSTVLACGFELIVDTSKIKITHRHPPTQKHTRAQTHPHTRAQTHPPTHARHTQVFPESAWPRASCKRQTVCILVAFEDQTSMCAASLLQFDETWNSNKYLGELQKIESKWQNFVKGKIIRISWAYVIFLNNRMSKIQRAGFTKRLNRRLEQTLLKFHEK